MNIRVLELLKNPKVLTESDLKVLESEAGRMPYAQSVRALYLYGISLYKTENYKENLSKTAAYTTDKKILYQFINSQKNSAKEILSSQQTEQLDENQILNEKTAGENLIEKAEDQSQSMAEASVVLNKFDVSKIIASEEVQSKDFILVDGEKNRLLYDGEENFLQEKSAEIDLEATQESGVITVKDDLQSKQNLIALDDNRADESMAEADVSEVSQEFPTTETKIQDDDFSADISFNGIDDFLPQVKFSVPKNHSDHLNPPKKDIEKSAIVEEEKPLSATEYQEQSVRELSENEIDHRQLSDEKAQVFDVLKTEETVAKTPVPTPEQPVSTWQPMSFFNNTPDALIGKMPEDQNLISKSKTEMGEPKNPELEGSLIGNEASQTEKSEEIPTIVEKSVEKEISESNVGSFINTWQSWLKIDRPKPEEPAEKTTVAKEKIIDQFIEKNPKISQLKDEVNFVVKEKKDDISHLMTETLAKLYVEQKLYSKAIKAYETLSEKHPQKADYYQQKIEEVKEIRKP
ncbi:MAG: hypothetical protein L6262_10815 [Weeksellaceae bacterium]|nr:hypothetical protein [Weeksellaceae bacterium]